MTRAVIALGSNLGDRDSTLRRAIADIGAVPGVDVMAASVPIESVALTVDGLDESRPAYLNGAALLETSLEPVALLDELNRIEDRYGRVRLEHWGDRTLDLDLVVFGDLELRTARLTLPHPRAHERSFVLEPWVQIEPDAELPGHGSIASLLARLDDEVAHVDGAPVLTAPPAPAAVSSHGATA